MKPAHKQMLYRFAVIYETLSIYLSVRVGVENIAGNNDVDGKSKSKLTLIQLFEKMSSSAQGSKQDI